MESGWRDEERVAVVMVNWNGWETTLAALAALRSTRHAAWHLILVDNASTDGSQERLSGLGTDVTLVKSAINGGWTGGNNLGLRAAQAAGFKVYFLLNNDALVRHDTIANLQAARRRASGAIVGPVHLDGAGSRYDFVGTDRDPLTGFPIWRPTDPEFVSSLPDVIGTATIKGAGIVLDAGHLESLGYFDERFFLNFDETDWCYKATKLGFPLLLVKSAVINHLGSASIGGMTSPLQSYFLARNALLFAEKHCSLQQRVQLLRRLYWEARDLPRQNARRSGWFWRFLTRPSRAQRAYKVGVRHYVQRRFGDCPSLIRDLNRQT